MSSHYVLPFTQRRGFGKYVQERAACGIWVNPETEHSVEPECERCRTYLEQQAKDTEALASKWDADLPLPEAWQPFARKKL